VEPGVLSKDFWPMTADRELRALASGQGHQVHGGVERRPVSQHKQKWQENAAEHDGFLLLS
jgi:hypothetical protein